MLAPIVVLICTVLLGGLPSVLQADTGVEDHQTKQVSPVRKLRKADQADRRHRSLRFLPSYDGSGHNRQHPEMNATHTQLRRYLANDYADSYHDLAGPHRASPRDISNTVFRQARARSANKGFSDFMWQWGQFLDHDIDLTDGMNPPEPWPIDVPKGDRLFDPQATGAVSIAFNRSVYTQDRQGVRQQLNEISGWIDASNVYGSDHQRAQALRMLDGSGRMKMSAGKLLPYNEQGLPNAGGDGAHLFLAGDVRANEQVGLLALHTLFVREHNRWIKLLRREYPHRSGEALYQHARALVTAQMQVITYREWLPHLLGKRALPKYRKYHKQVDARIMNEFSTAAFRFGHSMLSPQILRLNKRMQPVRYGHLPLRDAFFSPDEIARHGIASVMRGLSAQVAQKVDARVVDDVRNFLFGAPGRGGFDLVALNIQRDRDHGLPSYNQARIGFGLPPVTSFADITAKPRVQRRLARAYHQVDDIDMWVGGMAEDAHGTGMLGELFHHIVKQQFVALRDGDRYWYTRSLSKRDRKRIQQRSLADIIRDNTRVGRELPNNVFIVN